MTSDIKWFDATFELDKDGTISADKPAYTELWDEDDWEDADFQESINAKYPGWYLVKLPSFTRHTFDQIDPWLVDGVKFGQYSKVGWDSGCSYSVGVIFESPRDAMMFKLRWR